MFRRIFEFARMRPQAIVAGAMVVSLLVLIAGMLGSCGPGPGAPEPGGGTFIPPAPPPIAAEPTIRVRLADATGDAAVASSGPYALLADGKPVTASQQALPAASLRRDGRNWWLGNFHFQAATVRLAMRGEGHLGFAGAWYRGELVFRPGSDERTFSVDNHVDLEHYLAGVLARELYASWHVEAYKALAVAARTYALYEMQTIGARRDFDVYADQRSQVYGGVSDESAKSLTAVRQTWGLAMVYGSAGQEKLFKTYYSSCCGGVTNPAEGLEPQPGGSLLPLSGGVECHDCAAAPRYRWATARVSKHEAFTALARCYTAVALLGGLKEIRVVSSTAWGRPQWIDVIGTDGQSARIRADDLRLALLRYRVAGSAGLYSVNCTIRDERDTLVFENGRGFGHGVGLCQFGAQGKALRGLHYYDILYSYYPGAKIKRLY